MFEMVPVTIRSQGMTAKTPCKIRSICSYCELEMIFITPSLMFYQLDRGDISDVVGFVVKMREKQFVETDMDVTCLVSLPANIAVFVWNALNVDIGQG